MMFRLFQIVLVATFCFQLGFMKHEKRVIGGEDAPPDKYRWSVSIKGNVDELKQSGSCGASILNTKNGIYWLVTAAHCFFPSNGVTNYNLTKPEFWHARIGMMKVDFIYQKHGLTDKIKEKVKGFFNKAYNKLFGKNKFKYATNDLHIRKIIIHPNYRTIASASDDSNFRMDDDIALMKLKEPLPVDKLKGVSTIDLPDPLVGTSWPVVGDDCILVGWGCTAPKKGAHPIAKKAVLKIWDNKKCEKSIPTKLFMHPQNDFCAGYLNQSYGLCQGDSGSGLICNYNGKPKVAGVVSRGHGRNPGEYPAVFTRVSSYIDWIQSVVRNN